MVGTVIGIAAGVVTIAGGAVAVIRWLSSRRKSNRTNALDKASDFSDRTFPPPDDLTESLQRRIRSDFLIEGPHAGEFIGGREEGRHWQETRREPCDSKPAYYLTYWGWRAARTLFATLPTDWIETTTNAVASRIGDRHWISVNISDYDDPTVSSRSAETIRHTVRAADILLLLSQESRLVSQIAWAVVSDSEDSTSPEGGWYEFRGEAASGPSLFASLYVFHFLAELLHMGSAAPVDDWESFANKALPIAQNTESFLINQWEVNQWRYRSVPWQVGAPIVLAELVPYATTLEQLQHPVDSMVDLLNPSGRLRDPHVGEPMNASEYMVATRLAYGLHCWYERSGLERPDRVTNLTKWLLAQYRHDRQLTTCEVAFLAELFK